MENRLKITNPDRIDRILRKICDASMQVVMRRADLKAIAVRGRAATLHEEPGSNGMRISNISAQGMQHLVTVDDLQVEFRGMSTQVGFASKILVREQSSVIVAVPQSLVSLERRKSSRVLSTGRLAPFVKLGVWKPAASDLASPPVFPHFQDLASQVLIADISEGGLCCTTRFPAVVNALTRGVIDDHALLYFPMRTPLEVSLEVRWVKRIKERVKVEGAERFERHYRFGLQFVKMSSEARMRVRQFIQQLTVADAI